MKTNFYNDPMEITKKKIKSIAYFLPNSMSHSTDLFSLFFFSSSLFLWLFSSFHLYLSKNESSRDLSSLTSLSHLFFLQILLSFNSFLFTLSPLKEVRFSSLTQLQFHFHQSHRIFLYCRPLFLILCTNYCLGFSFQLTNTRQLVTVYTHLSHFAQTETAG